MSASSILLAALGEIHGDQQLYTLVAEGTPGANDLWQEVGALYMRMMGDPAAMSRAEAVSAVEGLRKRCEGPLSRLGEILDKAVAQVGSADWP